MYCSKCGQKIEGMPKFCAGCGKQLMQPDDKSVAVNEKTNGQSAARPKYIYILAGFGFIIMLVRHWDDYEWWISSFSFLLALIIIITILFIPWAFYMRYVNKRSWGSILFNWSKEDNNK